MGPILTFKVTQGLNIQLHWQNGFWPGGDGECKSAKHPTTSIRNIVRLAIIQWYRQRRASSTGCCVLCIGRLVEELGGRGGPALNAKLLICINLRSTRRIFHFIMYKPEHMKWDGTNGVVLELGIFDAISGHR